MIYEASLSYPTDSGARNGALISNRQGHAAPGCPMSRQGSPSVIWGPHLTPPRSLYLLLDSEPRPGEPPVLMGRRPVTPTSSSTGHIPWGLGGPSRPSALLFQPCQHAQKSENTRQMQLPLPCTHRHRLPRLHSLRRKNLTRFLPFSLEPPRWPFAHHRSSPGWGSQGALTSDSDGFRATLT